ncbi:hypothetical protein [Croceitalea rosinachiae]|uniref:Uncharacterized protein n=1 Tax=Croceitalea rosinachiae TaxID=3075596 RepID=A0ABU3AB22_9FLAO|nr:hypothetical protein [Croceitalea sp. F388]MDT0607386.1 hypothetical protein [Croceitalea sp. F388]
MKKLTTFTFLVLCLIGTEMVSAQFRNNNRYGRQQRTSIPQAQATPEEPKPKTADELVDEQMPKITESLELDPFEEAVVRSTLVKYVTKRLELQILKLEPKKMQEEFEKLGEQQTEELKAGLPEDKFEAYLELQENRFKTKKKKKKKKKNKT